MLILIPRVGECTSASAGDLKFTKITEAGLLDDGTWITDQLIQDNFLSSLTIPPNLSAGNYIIRHEIIALHGAGSDNGAQLYPQCLNLKLGGSGGVSVPEGVPGTSLYKRDDPGILFNLYTDLTSYPIPGPELWTGAN